MRTRVVTLCLVVALVGCETPPTYSSSRKEQMTVLHPGDAVVSALGTPFYLALQSVTCVLSAAIAGSIVQHSRCSSATAIARSVGRTASRLFRGADDRRGSRAGSRRADHALQHVDIDSTSVTTYCPRHARRACADSPPRSQAGCFAVEGRAPIGASKLLQLGNLLSWELSNR